MSAGSSPAVRRVMARDDLLTLAAAADRAIDIVRSREEVTRHDPDGRSLFDVAFDRQLGVARRQSQWALRARAWDRAAVLLRFGELVDARPETDYTVAQLHELAMREVDADDGLALDRDMTIGVFHRYHAARDLRMTGHPQDALDLVKVDVRKLFGTGAEPHFAHYLYEVGAVFIGNGQASVARRSLQEQEPYWKESRAAGFPTVHRFDFIRALARWDTDPTHPDVGRFLTSALDRLTGDAEDDAIQLDSLGDAPVRELSLSLAAAEHLAAGEHTAQAVAEAVRLGRQALDIADGIRARWRVMARSRAPLATVFERVFGDLALLAQRLPGQDAAELGFRVAVSAKQTGFAVRMRDGRTFDDNEKVNGLLYQIVEIEGSSSKGFADTPQVRAENLEQLRRELATAVSPMLADTVFPPPARLDGLLRDLGPRYALDFVELRDTLGSEPRLYRTLIRPGGRMWFDLCEPGGDFRKQFEKGTFVRRMAREVEPEAARPELTVDWRGLARAVLPDRLTGEILTDGRPPVQLVISAQSWLSQVPWAALVVDEAGTRLVERAVIAQTPVLTCLSGDLPPVVTGRALIRLVGEDEGGVNVNDERRAWDFGASRTGVPPHRVDLAAGTGAEPVTGGFAAALREPDTWQFLHVASHGTGRGFDQYLDLPGDSAAGEPRERIRLSAAQALALKWPSSVLMASCHVGHVRNDNDAEPLSFVMAVLTGGARCVVAGIDSIDDEGTGRTAARIVAAIRAGAVSLEVALREAQLAAVEDGIGEGGWALLSAYVR